MDISLSGVCKRYGAVEVVTDLSLRLPAGRVVALLGPSGCGKTTTLRMLAGLERVSAGTLQIGEAVVDDGARRFVPPERRGLGMVFQNYALWPHLNVLENVAYPLRLRGQSTGDARRHALIALERVKLSHLADRAVHQLSGGQQQRVAVARAVVGDGQQSPPVLLLDEPLANLDARLREDMRSELATLARTSGASVVLVTHDQQEAFAVADDVVVLDRGRLAQQGTPLDIYLRPASAFVGAFGGAMSVVDGRLHHGGLQLGNSHIDAAVVHVAGDISDGATVQIGLRPEWLRLATDGEAGIDVEVTQSLFLGREHDVSLRFGASHLGWRVASTLAAPTVGDRLRLVAVRACAFAR
jgi:ABC-type Fe3+/spermidine/putrescine transport system ATPase subunit